VREAVFDVLLALPQVREASGGATECWPEAAARSAPEADARGAGPLAGHVALDVFAGSGALGIEALSRGADRCTFVESAPPALRALRANLVRLGVPTARAGDAAAVVIAADARRALAADARRGARYTLVFADPPYESYEQVRPALARLLGRVLAPGAVLVVETAAATSPGLPWTVVRDKRYGDTRVTFLVAGAGP